MKAKRNHIIAKAYLEQKESIQITKDDGEVINFFIGRKYGENNREINPSVCEVLCVGEGVDQIAEGDLIIVHHNMIINEAIRIEKDTQEQSVIINLHANNMLYAKINKETGDLQGIYGNCIAERVFEPHQSFLGWEDVKNDYKFKIVNTPTDYTDVQPGQHVLCYKLSDYEMVYHFNGKENRAIKIMKDDILGVFN